MLPFSQCPGDVHAAGPCTTPEGVSGAQPLFSDRMSMRGILDRF